MLLLLLILQYDVVMLLDFYYPNGFDYPNTWMIVRDQEGFG